MSLSPFHVLIPSRMGSTRLLEKPMADIEGLPMVIRVAQQALKSQAQSVHVVTDHARIVEICEQHGIATLLTSSDYLTGSDRLAKACKMLGLDENAIVVNVQGDEPLIEPSLITQVAQTLAADTRWDASTLATPIEHVEEWSNPHIVKVVFDEQQRALYFSRAGIPFDRESALAQLPPKAKGWRHVGLYGYRVSTLLRFANWPASELEKSEALEQLRLLSKGLSIHVQPIFEKVHAGVDTPEDLERVRHIYQTRQKESQ